MNQINMTRRHLVAALLAASAFGHSASAFAAGQATVVGGAARYDTSDISRLQSIATTAKAMLPSVSESQVTRAALLAATKATIAGTPGSSTGALDREHLFSDLDVAPDAFGNASPESIAPYSTARASADVLGHTGYASQVGVTSYPWRATGKFTFTINGAGYYCSASMIEPGVLLTAAHCVYEFGTGTGAGWHANYVYTPAQYASGSPGPYGTWTVTTTYIASAYYYGTDTCYQTGVICDNDLAVVIMTPNRAKQLPGNVVGWYGYGWNGYSYLSSFGGAFLSSITQLGYPKAFDAGQMMERNDGIGAGWFPSAYQTVLGSAMTGGSSGGPWLVNFGARPAVDTSSASLGNAANADIVVGVTSWGYTTVGNNTQGASYFGQNKEFPSTYTDTYGIYRGAGNIGALVSAACSNYHDHC